MSLQARGMRAAFMPPERPHNLNIQDPHAIVRRAAAPGVPRCQRHCGIWSSTDDAAGGQVVVGAVPVSNFGYAVAVHPVGQDTAWFATAQVDEKRVPVDSAMVVNRIRDGGCRFETLLHGLPQTHCCDVVCRHGLAVANDGGSLLMGSTTGGLGSSSHGGDRWLKVSRGLPPVHTVKFGQVLYRGVSGGAGLWRRPDAASLELGRATRVGG
jgi:hypothetical protein